jgi:hypothetical protein
MTSVPFREDDLELLRARGISVDEASGQIARLSAPPRYSDVVRPCTPGDGIEVFDDAEVDRLAALGEEAARDGRCRKFVPASGAATRMFRSLLCYHGPGRSLSVEELEAEITSGSADAGAVRTFLDGAERFAFADDLRATLAARGHDLDTLRRRGPHGPILDALLSGDGMGYAALPKGLLKFHAYPEGARTPFEEHLVEAASVVKRADGLCRLSFTVSPEHLGRFESLLERTRAAYEGKLGVTLDVTFSTQKPSTDTLAVDGSNRPFRDDDGTLLFRPAGHGALLDNLGDLGADLVWVKNIDNLVPDRLKAATFLWGRALVGRVVRLQRRVFDALARLDAAGTDGAAVDDALALAREVPGLDTSAVVDATPGERRDALVRLLDRPVRACGMVRNTGEPGGGPFWVRDSRGEVTPQIVEMAQIDPDSPSQQRLVAASTHFNPVFMVCGLRDRHGRPYDLRDYVDPDTAIIARKSAGGRELKALERPGLWNGSMARWTTVFVEIPEIVFNPVKTVNVLLKDVHQGEG